MPAEPRRIAFEVALDEMVATLAVRDPFTAAEDTAARHLRDAADRAGVRPSAGKVAHRWFDLHRCADAAAAGVETLEEAADRPRWLLRSEWTEAVVR
jgi:hypothetical protein